MQTGDTDEVRAKFVQYSAQGASLETEIDDMNLMAARDESRGDIFKPERLRLEEWRQSKLDTGRLRLEE
jgi:hypothetical protein